MTKKVSVQQIKNITEIISDMNEQHGLVTQVSFKCPVFPGWRAAVPCNLYRIGSDPLASAKAAAETPGLTVPRHPADTALTSAP